LIDLHSHILFGLDDGAQSLEESLEIARQAAADGIEVLAATPHSPESTASVAYSPALVRERLRVVREALRAEGIALELVLGTEIAYVADLVAQLKRGALLPFEGTRAILLEPPFTGLPHGFEAVLFELQLAGYRVVLAHPERLPDVQEDPNRLIPLIERGVLMQLTAQALSGGQGEYMQQVAETLLQYGMIHILASDAHGAAPRRPPKLAHALGRAAGLLGAETADALVRANPRALLDGRAISVAPPRRVTGRWRW
jgi:protein-tyrosine phosphatase